MFGHNSPLGFFNNFTILFQDSFYANKYRTPYPPMKDNLQIKDVFYNFNFADFSIAFMCVSLLQYYSNKDLVLLGGLLKNKREAYSLMKQLHRYNTALGLGLGFLLAFTNSRSRLGGFAKNGLEWKYPNYMDFRRQIIQ